MIPHTVRLILILCILRGLVPVQATAAEPPLEFEVKAAFLYNFIRFIDWPEEAFSGAEDPILIGVLGENPFEGALERAVTGKTAHGRPIAIRHGKRLEDIGEVHMLYISRSANRNLGPILAQLESKPVVTVGEHPRFTARGGMIRFFLRERRVAFEINPAAAKEADLRISSRLLALADIYEGPTGAGQ